MNNAIKYSINTEKGSFKNSSLRLDCYHFFNKQWYDQIFTNCDDNNSLRIILTNIKNWILTWFKDLETKNELITSKQILDKYMSKNAEVIGSSRLEKITKLIQQVMTHQHELLHCYFKSKCTFDFIGDSIVEGIHYPLK